jgi:hypothetical protein
MPYMYKTEVTRGTYAAGAGMFDLTTANAFTGCADLSAYQDGKHLLWASDGTNTLLAWISATAPGGETLDVELVDAFANEPAYPYETFTPGAGSDITQAINNVGGVGICYKAINSTAGALYKEVATVTKASGANPTLSWGVGYTSVLDFAAGTTTGAYRTVPAGKTRLYFSQSTEATNYALTGFSFKRVTSPAATGALLLGSTGARGFISKSASFNANAAGSYRIYTTKKYRSV